MLYEKYLRKKSKKERKKFQLKTFLKLMVTEKRFTQLIVERFTLNRIFKPVGAVGVGLLSAYPKCYQNYQIFVF